MIDQILPGPQRQLEFRLFLPGDWRHLKLIFLVPIKDGATEKEIKRQVPIGQTVEVFCGRNVEIERAWHL